MFFPTVPAYSLFAWVLKGMSRACGHLCHNVIRKGFQIHIFPSWIEFISGYLETTVPLYSTLDSSQDAIQQRQEKRWLILPIRSTYVFTSLDFHPYMDYRPGNIYPVVNTGHFYHILVPLGYHVENSPLAHMQRQYVSLAVVVAKVQPGLRQKPSSVAERGVKVHGGSELYPARVGRDRAYASGDPISMWCHSDLDIGEPRVDDSIQGIDADLEFQKRHRQHYPNSGI